MVFDFTVKDEFWVPSGISFILDDLTIVSKLMAMCLGEGRTCVAPGRPQLLVIATLTDPNSGQALSELAAAGVLWAPRCRA